MVDLLYLLSYAFCPTAIFHPIAVKFPLKYLYLSPTLLALPSPWYLQSLWGSWGFFTSAELHWHWAEHSQLVGESWQTDAHEGKDGQTSRYYKEIRLKYPETGVLPEVWNVIESLSYVCEEGADVIEQSARFFLRGSLCPHQLGRVDRLDTPEINWLVCYSC